MEEKMHIIQLSQNEILQEFKDYLKMEGYSEFTPTGLSSTVDDYANRINYIMYYESLVDIYELIKNLNGLIVEYDKGGSREEVGNKSHRAVFNALKRFSEFLYYLEINNKIISSDIMKVINEVHLLSNRDNLKNSQEDSKVVFKYNENKKYDLYLFDGESEEMSVYISDKDIYNNIFRISPESDLAKILITKAVGDEFKINNTKYIIKNIEEI